MTSPKSQSHLFAIVAVEICVFKSVKLIPELRVFILKDQNTVSLIIGTSSSFYWEFGDQGTKSPNRSADNSTTGRSG